jgi:hypothetical protein
MTMAYVDDTLQHENHPDFIWKLKETRGWVELSRYLIDNNGKETFYSSVSFPVEMTQSIADWINANYD